MNEKEIIKLIKSKSQAIGENLLLSTELTEIKVKIAAFLDKNLKEDSLTRGKRIIKSSNTIPLSSPTRKWGRII